jgi:hypothetical protein
MGLDEMESAEMSHTADYEAPDCECAMTEATFRACPMHGEDSWCPTCGEPHLDHPATCHPLEESA